MTKLFKSGSAIVKEGIASLKTIRSDRQEYKAYLARIQALPHDYRLVYEKSTQYMWQSYGGGSGYDMIALQTDLLELFESCAAEGRTVLEITGPDIAAFCDDLLRSTTTYQEKQRTKLNQEILRSLKPSSPNQ